MNVTIPEGKENEFVSAFKWMLGNLLQNGMVRRVAVDTGDLKNSINFKLTDNGITFYMREHGKYVEWGTSPHIIRIKDKKVLSDGERIFGKQVQHPGTTPQPFIRPTFHQDLQRSVNDAAQFAAKAIQ